MKSFQFELTNTTCRRAKKYWRTILKKNSKVSDASLKQFPLFQRKFLTESDVLYYLLFIDSELRESYEIYQELLAAFDAKEPSGFFEWIETLSDSLNPEFKKAIRYLEKHKKAIKNTLNSPYFNGKLEGKNNLIKIIKKSYLALELFATLEREF